MRQFLETFSDNNIHNCSKAANRWLACNPDVVVIDIATSPPVYNQASGLGIGGKVNMATVTLLCVRKEGSADGND